MAKDPGLTGLRGSGFRVQGLGSRIQGLGCRACFGGGGASGLGLNCLSWGSKTALA